MLVRLFEVRAEDLTHLVGAPGGEMVGWPPGTRCLEVALVSEDRDPPASKALVGAQLARIWSRLLPDLIPDEPGLVHLLRIHASWNDPAGLGLLSQVQIGNRRFAVSGARRTRTRASVPPLTAVLELTPAELGDAIDHWGQGAPEVSIEVMALPPDAAGVVLRADAGAPVSAGEVAGSLRLYMTSSRDRRSLFIISDQAPEAVRKLLEGTGGD